jgi:D-alanyl-D-alanine carboxypeptidase/D-alanyl-D-alanine-endopeptidase (penicillin-binding protein 4)
VRTLRREGRATGAYVYDLTDRRVLFTLRARVPRPPASVEKIYTSVALLRLLGPQADLHTALLGTGHLAPHGVWRGNLYLRGDGDPTFGDGWYDHVYEGGYGSRVTDLVVQLRRRGIRRVAGWIYGDGSRFDSSTGGPATAGRPDTPDYGGEMSALVYDHGASSGRQGPAAFAAHELALTMRAQHIFGRAASRPRQTPRGARRLAVVKSPRLLILLKLMDVPSDDLFADLLTKQLGFHFHGRGTLNAGAAEIRDALAPYRLEAVIHDGSGLDRSDLTTPESVVSLLRQIWHSAVGRMLAASLPVVGISGTVQSMAVRTPAQGRCVAKTGTLDNVTNLAGECASRGHHQLLFALFIDGPVNWEAYGALGRMVAAIAGY